MTGGQQASGKKRTWFGRVFGNVGGSIGRRDYFIGVVLILLVSAALGHYFFMNRPDVFYTLNPDTPDAMKKLMFPAVTVPLRLFWVYLDSKRLRSLGLPAILAAVAHAVFIVDLVIPGFGIPALVGLIFYIYLACLLLLAPRLRIIGHSRTGRTLTILGMEEKE